MESINQILTLSLKHEPIAPDRIVGIERFDLQKHLCYICGNLAQDPR